MPTCPTCATSLPDGSLYCLACGAEVKSSEAASTLLQRRGASAEVPASGGVPRFLPGALFGERHRIVGLLGRGGMGEVYRADDLKLAKTVALKLLPSALSRDLDFLERFHQEVRIAHRVSHPHVCRVFDIGQVDDQHFLSMEYVDGENLASLLRRVGYLPPEKAIEIARQLSSGLSAAHERNVLHRDLKPANVMIDGQGRARITDFGLAGAEGDLTERAVRSGTPAYMAPEQLSGGQVSVRSDLYSLGLIFHETLTGQRLFAAASPAELARRQKEAGRFPRAAFSAGVAPLAEEILLRCLAYDPADRPASAAEVIDALPASETLRARCRACGFRNHLGFRYCGRCGAALERNESPTGTDRPAAPGPQRRGARADHRQLTALFCDLSESTALAEKHDPEELSELLQAYHEKTGEVVERFGGHVAQRLGDGLRAFFGYPRAHEDDARRAVFAGLEILALVERLNRGLGLRYGIRLGVRVCAHTESVVAGELVTKAGRELLATGPTLNIAALLLGQTPPGKMFISGATHRLVRGFFEFEELGPYRLRGISRQIDAFRVRGEEDWGSRFELAVSGELTPLAGRDLEMALLDRCLDRAFSGRGQAVLIAGEPGIGKSRLVYQIREQLSEERARWFFCRASTYHEKSAFFPILRLLKKVLGFRPRDLPEQKRKRLERRLGIFGFTAAAAAEILAALLALPHPNAPGSRFAPPELKKAAVRLLLSLVLRASREKPVILVVEDLHWIDPSSLSFLELLIQQVPTSAVLVLMTARPEFAPPWPSQTHLTNLNLDRLEEGDTRSMIDELTDGKPLPPEMVSELLAKADGVPLAVEELTRMVLDSDLVTEGETRFTMARAFSPLAIPATLQDSLEARLDRLGRYREVAELASALGREFSYGLLEAASTLDPAALREGLLCLVDEEILLQRGFPPDATYIFVHALIQEAAYLSLLRDPRRKIHRQVAQALLAHFPQIASSQPELIAHHLTEAGEGARAVEHWLRAGRRAAERFASSEAVDHFERGRALLAEISKSSERERLERLLSEALESVD